MAIGADQANLLQGTLDLLILEAIGDGEFHGLTIALGVEQITQGMFKVRPGSLNSSSSSHGRSRMAELLLGQVREQQALEVLPAYKGRRASAGSGNGTVDTISRAIGHALKTPEEANHRIWSRVQFVLRNLLRKLQVELADDGNAEDCH